MSFIRLCGLAAVSSCLFLVPFAKADTFTSGSYYSGNQNNFTTGEITFTIGGTQETAAAGNITGSSGVSGGSSYAFADTFCVDLYHDIYLDTTYTATYTNTGVVEGAKVGNAGEIAWLISNIAPTVTTSNTAANEALQAAIWQVEYGSAFVMSTTANSSTIVSDFNADLSALSSAGGTTLDNNAALIASVSWMTPVNTNGTFAQAQVVYVPTTTNPPTNREPLSTAPEPNSLVLLGTGILGAAGAARRRFRRS